VKAIAVIAGVMLFLWSTAVIATGLSFLVTDRRLGRREWYQVFVAVAVFVACIVAFFALDMDAPLPEPPLHKTAPAIP
jgi:uncharacterized membrane protein